MVSDTYKSWPHALGSSKFFSIQHCEELRLSLGNWNENNLIAMFNAHLYETTKHISSIVCMSE